MFPVARPALFPVTVASPREESESAPQLDWTQLQSFDAKTILPKTQAQSGFSKPPERQEDAVPTGESESEDQKSESSSGSDASSDSSQRRRRRRRGASTGAKRSSLKAKKRSSKSSKRKRARREKESDAPAARKRRGPLTDAEKIAVLEARAAARDAQGSQRRAWTGWRGGGGYHPPGLAASDPPKDPFFFDTQPDPDNLAYGCVYRMDVASYHLDDTDWYELGDDVGFKMTARQGRRIIATESDGHKYAKNATGRYFSAKEVMRERSRTLRRVRVGERRAMLAATGQHARLAVQSLGEVVPLKQPPEGEEDAARGESVEEYVTRRTKEFNVETRERPFDINAWLQFAAFQDVILKLSTKRADEKQLAEKKIAIYERALSYHKGSETLLLAMLEESKRVEDPEALEREWRRVLRHHGGCAQLWRAYLAKQASQFTGFSMSAMRRTYAEALQALGVERVRRQQSHAPPELVEEMYHAQLDLVVDLCQLEMHSGHTEMMVARVQALLEYTCFAPDAVEGASEASKTRVFQRFWESKAAQIGEEGARGWAHWYEHGPATSARDETDAETCDLCSNTPDEPGPQDDSTQQGGWGGWQDLPAYLPPQEDAAAGEEARIDSASDDEDDERVPTSVPEEEADASEEEDDAALMAKLGLKLDEGLKGLGNEMTEAVQEQWLQLEESREAEQWMPIRIGGKPDPEDAASLDRAIEFDDVRESLVTLPPAPQQPQGADRPSLRESAVHRCLVLLRAAHGSLAQCPPWGSNHSCPFRSLAHAAETAHTFPLDQFACQSPPPPAWLMPCGGSGEALWCQGSPGRHRFLHNLLALVVRTFPAHAPFRDALVAHSMHPAATPPAPDAQTQHPPTPHQQCAFQPRYAHVPHCLNPAPVCRLASEQARVSAKQTLSNHIHDLQMWAAYAWAENAAGKPSTARRVMDTVLSSLPSLPPHQSLHAPQAYLAYAEMELQTGGPSSQLRALHILCSLPEGGAYKPLPVASKKCPAPPPPPSDLSTERVRQCRAGYQALLQDAMQNPCRRICDERGVAVVACLALFTYLTTGLKAACTVYSQVLALVPEATQRESAVCEALTVRQVALMQAAAFRGWGAGGVVGEGASSEKERVPMEEVLVALHKGLQTYPSNPHLLMRLLVVEGECSAWARLRRTLDITLQKHTGTEIWMQALQVEARSTDGGLGGTTIHRIRSLLERSVSTASKNAGATRSKVLLWRVYLAYELALGRPDSARRVYFRAINACPWSKALWLDGFKSLRDHMSPSEMGELLDVMREKDLRLRTDVYEILLMDAV